MRAFFFTEVFLLNHIADSKQLEKFIFFTNQSQCRLELEKAEAETLLQLFEILHVKRNEKPHPFHIEIIRSIFFTFLFETARLFSLNGKLLQTKTANNPRSSPLPRAKR